MLPAYLVNTICITMQTQRKNDRESRPCCINNIKVLTWTICLTPLLLKSLPFLKSDDIMPCWLLCLVGLIWTSFTFHRHPLIYNNLSFMHFIVWAQHLSPHQRLLILHVVSSRTRSMTSLREMRQAYQMYVFRKKCVKNSFEHIFYIKYMKVASSSSIGSYNMHEKCC